jgi:PPP family 3-phenylpropionic acid transporter
VALVICFLFLTLAFPPLHELKQARKTIVQPAEQKGSLVSGGFLRKYERFIPFMIGIGCLFIFHTIINVYLVQIITPLGGKDSDLGISLTIAALCELPAFFGFSYLVSRFDTRTLLKAAGIFYVLRSLVFLFASSVWMVNLGQVIQGVTYALYLPASVYYINQIMKDEDKVKGQTLITGATTLGSVCGSIVGGWLLDRFNIQIMLIFGVAAAVGGCLFVIYSVSKKASPKTALVQP